MVSSKELRRTFLEYFRERGHEVVPSSPLVPANDPTLLFTNAGMVQFKDVFLGQDQRPYRRAVTAQRCVRAGGKHNDLENVGYTARHHTFFEMLGNFSFGDYFKREAIGYAWELLTQVFKLPPERLWVTVYQDDDEAADIWVKEIGVDPERFTRCGEKDNFWAMGDTGPCGPCSEIFYDHGPEVPGGPPGTPEEDGDRYIELWNLVFMQFDRADDGTLTALPKPSVDTGMGLERLAAVMQGVHSNYGTDLFRALIAAAARITGARSHEDKSLRVIADHIRSSAFLIVDGVLPSNEGRGYVLRRIIRRALRHGHKLGMREPFFYRLVEALEQQMGEAYPELRERRETVERVLEREEERFAQTLHQGMRLLEQAIGDLSGDTIPGETAFRLYDTYGFPVDLTADIAREHGLKVDYQGFEAHMQRQRERARAASHFVAGGGDVLDNDLCTEFTGYDRVEDEVEVTGLYVDGTPVDALRAGESGLVVLNRTPFYAESGGQVGDIGVLKGGQALFQVADTRRQGAAETHIGRLEEGELKPGDRLYARVDAERRDHVKRNHTGTHLVHAALRKVLGRHVQQKGSLVAPGRLRFDFSHYEPVRAEQLRAIERLVNDWILRNDDVQIEIMSFDDAMDAGALAFFDEKYGELVRVLTVGDYSKELCGGTHTRRSGDIGLFKIISETGVAAGVRRIEALTGTGALEWLTRVDERMGRMARLVKTDPESLDERLGQLIEHNRDLEKQLEQLKTRLAASQGEDLLTRAVEVDGLKVLAAKLEGADARALRNTVDQLKNKLGAAVVVLASVDQGKVNLVAGVTRGDTARIQASALANYVAGRVGGRGGGRPDLAQAGGNDPSAVDEALGSVPGWVREHLRSGA
jgi:alanyl-tRNA synthetase